VAEVARVQAAFPYREEIDSALRKITFDQAAPDRAGDAPQDLRLDLPSAQLTKQTQKHLGALAQAVHGRKRVTIRYRKTSPAADEMRTVDPYGLVYRHGQWLLVGHCHLRKDVRSFRVDRVSDVRVAGRPAEPDFERPRELDVRAYAGRSPWTFEAEPKVPIVLEATPELAHVAREDFGPGAREQPLASGGVRIEFACGNPAYAVARVMSAAGRLRVVAPAALRERVRQAAQAAAERYA
jgi:proteasome accessory factor B